MATNNSVKNHYYPNSQIPDFFIAGPPKCGTSSLYSWLKTHPDIYMPIKEPGYFSQDIMPVPEKTLAEYVNLFDRKDRNGKLVGEASPKYLHSNMALRQIYNLRADVLIIVILRNPVDLAHAFHGQMVREGFETEVDFESAWCLAEQRRIGLAIPKVCPWPKLLDYPFWGCIGDCLRNLVGIFPSNQIKILFLEDMARNPRQVYQDVLDFLKLSDDGRNMFDFENVRISFRSIFLQQLLVNAKRKLSKLLDFPPHPVSNRGTGVLKLINYFNVKPGVQISPMNERFRKELINYFEQQVLLIEGLTERHLSHWRGFVA